jgi:hypothetical protein
MIKEKDFWIANENCKEALKELLFDANKVKWLIKYQGLFRKVLIKPKGLPEIVNCNLNGITYCFIIEFHQKYKLAKHELSN